MYADPQSLTVNAVAKSLPRTASTPQGVFETADGEFTFRVSQNKTSNRFRREVRFTQKKIAADPISAVNKEVSASVIIAIDEPRTGFSDTELGYLTSALVAWFTAGNRDKLLGGEI
jgi:crotonobetainyl-CoA:carnitine CoA-transferase CaiB-like acyl-CoA transferase